MRDLGRINMFLCDNVEAKYGKLLALKSKEQQGAGKEKGLKMFS